MIDIIIKADSWNPSNVIVLVRSGKTSLVSDPIRDPGRISFTVSLGHGNKVIESLTSFMRLQDELCVLLGAVHGVERKEASDGSFYRVGVLTTSLGKVLQLLSESERIKLLFDKSYAVRRLLSSYVRVL